VTTFGEGAKRVGTAISDVAASSASGIERAILQTWGTTLTKAINLALGVCVQNHLVSFVVIDTLDDINLCFC
jgi:hypothetical protein